MVIVRRMIKEQLWRYRKTLLLIFLLTAMVSSTPYIFSLMGKWLVDEALQVAVKVKKTDGPEQPLPPGPDQPLTIKWKANTPEQKLHLLTLFLAIGIGIHFVATGVSLFSEYLNSRITHKVTYNLRTGVHDKIVAMEMKLFSCEQVGQLMTRVLDDAGSISTNLINLTVNFSTQIAMLLLGMVLLLRLNPSMALVAIFAFPFYAVSCAIFLPKIEKNTNEIRERLARINGYLVERLANIITVKNYAQEEQESQTFNSMLEENRTTLRSNNRYNLLFATFTTLITGFATLTVLLLGFLNIKSQKMQLGEVLAFYQVMAQLFVPISALVAMTNVVQTLEVIGNRVYSVLDTPDSESGQSQGIRLNNIKGEIIFNDVWHRYREGRAFAVQGIKLTIRAGATVCLVGPTGCGKSTLLNLLTRLYEPERGTITIDGVDIREMELRYLRQIIGNVLHTCQVFSGTIADNIAYGVPQATPAEIENVAAKVGLDSEVAKLAQGYATKIGRGGMALDSQQLVRLALARALATNPAILTVDDIYAAIEDQVEQYLRRAVRNVLAEKTILIATSRLAICEDADLVVVMQKGQIVQTGTHQQLLENPGLYRRMFMRENGIDGLQTIK